MVNHEETKEDHGASKRLLWESYMSIDVVALTFLWILYEYAKNVCSWHERPCLSVSLSLKVFLFPWNQKAQIQKFLFSSIQIQFFEPGLLINFFDIFLNSPFNFNFMPKTLSFIKKGDITNNKFTFF